MSCNVDVIGFNDCPIGHEIRDFLAVNNVPFNWHDIENCDLDVKPFERELNPIVDFNKYRIYKPTLSDVANELGYNTTPKRSVYDVVIVGGGPAGLSAAINSASEGLTTLLIDRKALGGQAGSSSLIKNYLGFAGGVSGSALASQAKAQAEEFGVETVLTQEVEKLECHRILKRLQLSNGRTISAKSVIISTGVSYNKLNLDGLDDLYGRSVFYGASVSESKLSQGKEVCVIGGGNSAGQAAIHLSKYAKHVRIVVRGDDIRAKMSEYLVKELELTDNISIHTNTELTGTTEKGCKLNGELFCGMVFIFIGSKPRTQWLEGSVLLDDHGYVKSVPSKYMFSTSSEGVFAIGDVRSGSTKRVAGAVGEGSVVISQVHSYLTDKWGEGV